jgi:hypothetical protein
MCVAEVGSSDSNHAMKSLVPRWRHIPLLYDVKSFGGVGLEIGFGLATSLNKSGGLDEK